MSKGSPIDVVLSEKLGSQFQEQERWINNVVRKHGLTVAADVISLLPGGHGIAVFLSALDRFDEEKRRRDNTTAPNGRGRNFTFENAIKDHGLFAARQMFELIPHGEIPAEVLKTLERIGEHKQDPSVADEINASKPIVDDFVGDHGAFAGAATAGLVPNGESLRFGLSQLDRIDQGARLNNGDMQTDTVGVDKSISQFGTEDTFRETPINTSPGPNEQLDEILLKSPSVWTRPETEKVQSHILRLPPGHPDREPLDKLVAAHYRHVYGSGELQRDVTGRQIEPEQTNAANQQPSELKTPQGENLNDSAIAFAEKLAKTRSDDDLKSTVHDLQAGLNLFETESIPRRPLLKTDGTFGPKTRTRLRQLLARQGRGRADEALAIGRFHRLIDQARKGNPSRDLKHFTEKTIGRLFRAPHDSRRDKIEAQVLQEVLNDITAGRTERLQEDGDIGPRTERAFALASRLIDPEDFSRRFAKRLQFLN